MTAARQHHQHRSVAGGQARAAVFGVSDGLVSNVSLILGFAGAGSTASVVRLAGVAGRSPVPSAWRAGSGCVSRTERADRREFDVERRELARDPDGRDGGADPALREPTAYPEDAAGSRPRP